MTVFFSSEGWTQQCSREIISTGDVTGLECPIPLKSPCLGIWVWGSGKRKIALALPLAPHHSTHLVGTIISSTNHHPFFIHIFSVDEGGSNSCLYMAKAVTAVTCWSWFRPRGRAPTQVTLGCPYLSCILNVYSGWVAGICLWVLMCSISYISSSISWPLYPSLH